MHEFAVRGDQLVAGPVDYDLGYLALKNIDT